MPATIQQAPACNEQHFTLAYVPIPTDAPYSCVDLSYIFIMQSTAALIVSIPSCIVPFIWCTISICREEQQGFALLGFYSYAQVVKPCCSTLQTNTAKQQRNQCQKNSTVQDQIQQLLVSQALMLGHATIMLELNVQAFCCPPYGQPNDQRVGRPGSCTVARRAARVTTCGCWGEAACLPK